MGMCFQLATGGLEFPDANLFNEGLTSKKPALKSAANYSWRGCIKTLTDLTSAIEAYSPLPDSLLRLACSGVRQPVAPIPASDAMSGTSVYLTAGTYNYIDNYSCTGVPS
jgi:hypothetical protein